MNLPQPYEQFHVTYSDNDDEISKAFAYINNQGNDF